MPSRVTVYEVGLVRAVQSDGQGFTRDKAEQIKVVAVARAPERSGRLKASHRVEQARGRGGQYQAGSSVSADAPHARWVHGGTGPYTKPNGVMGPLYQGPRVVGMPKYIRSRRGQAANPWLLEAAESVL